MMCEDQMLGRLLAMLVMFSPVEVELTRKEEATLKQFQSQVTIIMYNHILGTEENTGAVSRLSHLVDIIRDIHRCGVILWENILQACPDSDSLDIDVINI